MTFGNSDSSTASPKKNVELNSKMFIQNPKSLIDEAEIERMRIEEQNESAALDTNQDEAGTPGLYKPKFAKQAKSAAILKIDREVKEERQRLEQEVAQVERERLEKEANIETERLRVQELEK